jgi:tripartite-type tricarboxylate transporter receptor subunit TctC
VLLALVALTCAHARDVCRADPIAEFYKVNPISIYVSSAPGGGYDSYARLLARHLGRHVPGSPTVIVKNMPGAGGARAANYVFNVAPKDGTNIVMPQNTLTIDQFTSVASLKVDMRGFAWLGSMNVNQSVCIFSRSVAPLAAGDFFSRKIVLGASGGLTASPHLLPTLMNQLTGTKFEVIAGYEGTNTLLLALEQGEVEGLCGIGWDSVKVQTSGKITSGNLIVGLDVGITQDPELKDMGVPFFLSLIPDGEPKATLELILSVQLYGRPFALAPGVPQDRLDSLRSAFLSTMSDEALLTDAARANMAIQYRAPQDVLHYVEAPFVAARAIRDRALAELRKAGWGK